MFVGSIYSNVCELVTVTHSWVLERKSMIENACLTNNIVSIKQWKQHGNIE